MEGKQGLATIAISTATLLFFILSSLQPTAAAPAILRNESLLYGFYDSTCPRAEQIVLQTMTTFYGYNPAIAAGLIRLYLHDCFVRGCDASILIDDSPTGEPVEKDSPANGNTLVGLEVIDEAKFQLEKECPGIVSCADILAFAARDATMLAGLPRYMIPAGRRDGTISRQVDVLANIPAPGNTMTVLTKMFKRKGFNQTELAILSGAHSIGGSHCRFFSNRLYQDVAIVVDPSYADVLRNACPANLLTDHKINFDPVSPLTLDASYYNILENGRALLSTDQVLMTNKVTRRVAREMMKHPDVWVQEFTKLMVKLGNLDVLVGNQGEIRTSCRSFN